MKEKFTSVTGVRTRYYETGEGECLLMLHGAGPGASGISNFRKNMEALSQGRRVIALDLPSFGGTELKLPEVKPGLFEFMGEFVVAFMETVGIEKASLVGNSMGGAISVYLAMEHPQRCEKLILMGPAGGQTIVSQWPTPAIIKMATFYDNDAVPTLEKLKDIIDMMVVQKGEITDELLKERLEAASQPEVIKSYILRHFTAEELWLKDYAQIKHETLIIWGREDQVLPLDMALPIIKRIPNARLHVMPNCGHWAQWEKADEFNAIAETFLNS